MWWTGRKAADLATVFAQCRQESGPSSGLGSHDMFERSGPMEHVHW